MCSTACVDVDIGGVEVGGGEGGDAVVGVDAGDALNVGGVAVAVSALLLKKQLDLDILIVTVLQDLILSVSRTCFLFAFLGLWKCERRGLVVASLDIDSIR